MPEQKSTLTTDVIKSILKVNYHISVSSVSPLGHGSANCFYISDGNDMYFLKEYQSRFTESDLNRETCLINYLLKQKYPTAEIVPALQGNLYLKYQDRFILLQKYVSGKTYKTKLPHHLLMEASEWLGKLHSILRHYTLPCGMDIEWLKAFCPDKIAAEYDNLLEALEMQKNDIFYEHIKRDLLYKRDLVYQLSDFDNYYDGITYCASHGDYTCLQYICDNDHIVAIIDFSSAQTLPVIWEIMRSYVQSTDSCKDGALFDVDDFCKYVGRYLEYAPLSKKDLAAMPYVYLNQLSRSKYGYKEYLITKTENRDDLIQFAFWRTDICREIFHKRDEISTRLCSLL